MLTAMPFIMIVVTTSWAPVLTLRIPGIAAYTMPPRQAKSSTTGRWDIPGRKSKVSAAHEAVTIPTRNWPFDADVEQPALKQTDTASAAKISGVAIARTEPMLVMSLNANPASRRRRSTGSRRTG